MNTSTRPSTTPSGEPGTGRRIVSVLVALSASAALAAPTALAAPAALAAPTALAAPAAEPDRRTASTPLTPSVSPIRWGGCPANEPFPEPGPPAECGTIRVPVDWAKPKGPKTEVFVARYRATDPAQRIGVLMSNPGGPGNPGADTAMYADLEYTPEMLRRFDIVSFDPRGIGRSEGIRCDESLAAKLPARPRDAAEFERLRTLNGKLAESCLRQMGPLAAHMDTDSVARDMDAIRAAVGEERISYLGHSYGTSVGERYARLFPERLRALALDSSVDPSGAGAERFLTDAAVTLDAIFERLRSWCQTDPTCVLKGRDLAAVNAELFARAEAGTLYEPGPNGPTRKKIDADQLTNYLYGTLRRLVPDSAAEELAALHSGTGRIHLDPYGPDRAWQLVLCRDNDFRIRDWAHYRSIRARVEKAAPHVRHSSQALDMVLGCQGWLPPKPRPAQAEGALPPVLLVNATLDAATPLAGARRMAAIFPKATLLTVDDVGHWMYNRPESKRTIDAYLSGRRN
ncbi:alpha/beta fold hydrolase [Streptomyces sp. NPDC091377]|uniref:alpha/beta fold hydrolase n=1 Tax=Streptomyces sp. NPDC091377 TaxID=3365995 RepID=UPI00381F0ECC